MALIKATASHNTPKARHLLMLAALVVRWELDEDIAAVKFTHHPEASAQH